jgi:integrase/recombinase XerD
MLHSLGKGHTMTTAISSAAPTAPATTASAEARLIDQWLHGRSPHTQDAYRTALRDFRRQCDAPLDRVTLGDLQAWADQLGASGAQVATQALRLTAVKSLLSFGHRLGVLPVNVGAALRVPARRSRLAERILPEADVHRLLALTTHPRNHAFLRLLYASGLRVSEATALRWCDLQAAGDAGQVTVWGKGDKERAVRLPAGVWLELQTLRSGAGDDAPVFRSRTYGGHLDRTQAERIVRAAAVRAGIAAPVSPHWLRHALASHSLDRGCPIHVLQQTLGHSSLTTTSRYSHARPGDSAGMYIAV